MKLFLKRLGVFFGLIAVIFIIGILLPATPRTSGNLLFGQYKKDSLLKAVPSPRIIFIGGSNLSFGLNSQLIFDSLHINPVNTAIHADLGLVYMMEHALPFIKQNDLVIISPEYHQFYGDMAYGSEELLRTLVEISPNEIKKAEKNQVINIITKLPKYSFSKFKPIDYFTKPDATDIYSVNSFNKYGDAYFHWNRPSQKNAPDPQIKEAFNKDVLIKIKNFEQRVNEKGASLFITFPCYEESSFDNNKIQITEVYTQLKNDRFNILGIPEEFRMPDSLIFNTNYHLTKQGADMRTQLLIRDLKALNITR